MITPSDLQVLAEIIAAHAAEDRQVFIRGSGSKESFGRPVDAETVIDLSDMAGILDYEPSELYITVRAGTTLPQILDVLSPHQQCLAFEPPAWPEIFGGALPQTAGGIVACNAAGPRRIRAGAARDHFLGFAAVNGRGEAWRAGAKVVKNVSGYDMCKLQAGAFGTLSVLTEVTFRLLPAPETSGSIAVTGLSEAEGVHFMAQAMNTPNEVSAAAHLPTEAAARVLPEGLEQRGSGAVTVLRVEGHAPSVAYRLDELEKLHAGGLRLMHGESETLWRRIGAVQPLLTAADTLLWRICTKPSASASLLQDCAAALPGSTGFLDWAGGLIWLEVPGTPDDAGAATIRRMLAPHGGHATLVRAPQDVRRRVAVFQPLEPALARLTQRVKSAFDPAGVLNPGRMFEGF